MRIAPALLATGGAGLAVFFVVELARQQAAVAGLHRQVDDLVAAASNAPAPAAPTYAVFQLPAPGPAAAADSANARAKDVNARAAQPEAPARDYSLGAIRDRYEGAFVGEPTDSRWASDAERVANSKLPSLLPAGARLKSIECRTAMCRIELSGIDATNQSEFMDEAFIKSSTRLWNAASYAVPLDDGTGGGPLVVYVSREDHALPEVPE